MAQAGKELLIIGAPNCSRCDMVKKQLTSKEIPFVYKQIDKLSVNDRQSYLELAKQAGNMQLPVIIKNNESITAKEAIS